MTKIHDTTNPPMRILLLEERAATAAELATLTPAADPSLVTYSAHIDAVGDVHEALWVDLRSPARRALTRAA